uniref:uncharacterized protein LOC128928718 n=1 Tax=Callithrix jacchus TaxID=9483 RepID=UPI0023DD4B22|nr:uncharacterized protein LOC128928718 [Callithrix jacchus]
MPTTGPHPKSAESEFQGQSQGICTFKKYRAQKRKVAVCSALTQGKVSIKLAEDGRALQVSADPLNPPGRPARPSAPSTAQGLGPQRVCSRLARLGAPRGGAVAPRGWGGRGAERLGVHQPGLPTHAALRGGGGGGGGGRGGGGGGGGGGGARSSPPRARQSPSGRPRLRRTRLLGSAEPHTGRAALAGHGQLRRPHAAVRNGSGGRGAAPSLSAATRPAWGGARGHQRMDGRARGGCALLRAGTLSAPGGPQYCRGRQGEENAHPFRSGAPFSPHPHASRSTLAAQLLPVPQPQPQPPPPPPPPPPPKLGLPPLPPWLGAVT